MRLPNVKKPCGKCPFRKDSLEGWLGDERMTEILESDAFVCHKETSLQCAGHMLIKGEENMFVRTANRLRIPLKLSGEELVFDSQQDCIDHHGHQATGVRLDNEIEESR
ncbi:MAG: hypothetical protein HRT93_03350 [Piscirickettsiaceae bacterium]|nr:hypothetical protein [Piscirickettsiaceae bacterium]